MAVFFYYFVSREDHRKSSCSLAIASYPCSNSIILAFLQDKAKTEWLATIICMFNSNAFSFNKLKIFLWTWIASPDSGSSSKMDGWDFSICAFKSFALSGKTFLTLYSISLLCELLPDKIHNTSLSRLYVVFPADSFCIACIRPWSKKSSSKPAIPPIKSTASREFT